LRLVANAVQRYSTTRKTELAQHLRYNDRFTFARRIGKIVDRYPDIATAYPEIKALFGKARDD
ncbi:MAG: hypothetical protein RBU21_22535, partial [FCB group bacterium]|nr:hypothetical protein [FCB group bacterium]